MKPNWLPRRVKIAELHPNPDNPRTIKASQFKRLKLSLEEDGTFRPIICDTDMTVLGGHMRMLALRELGENEVDIVLPDRPLNETERQRITIKDNLHNGDWDIDKLANAFNMDDLISWGFPDSILDGHEESDEGSGSGAPRRCPHCGGEL